MPFEEGRKKTGGRKKGTPNKATAMLKESILASFDKMGREEYLVRMAEEQPRAYLNLLGKVLPSEIKADVDVSGRVTLIRRDLTGEQSD